MAVITIHSDFGAQIRGHVVPPNAKDRSAALPEDTVNTQEYGVDYDTSREGSSTQAQSLPHHWPPWLRSSLVLVSYITGSLCKLHAMHMQCAEFKAHSWCIQTMKAVLDRW